MVSHTHAVDTEVGRLRAVLLHRPGAELRRIRPGIADGLQFAAIPWLRRAQQEHDLLAQQLREQDVEVLYLTELVQEALQYAAARGTAIGAVLADPRFGGQLRRDLRRHLIGLDPEELAQVLVAGLSAEEFRPGRGVVFGLLGRHDFVIEPLPNLVFARDASMWVADRPVIASLGERRRRECVLAQIVYTCHPRFAGVRPVCGPGREPLTGADILQLAPGVVAAGISEQTTPAGVERLAGELFRAGLARSVLAVPLASAHPGARLDTVCTVVDDTTLLMAPALAYTLRVHVITPGPDGLRVSRPQPFLEAAAEAMGAASLQVIGTGVSPATDSRGQWDDGGNALALAPGVLLSYERNEDTNDRLEAAGMRIIRVPGSELGGSRGGPRGLACPLSREPGPARAGQAEPAPAADAAATPVDTVARLPGEPDLVPATPA